jgi:hypothetical protein
MEDFMPVVLLTALCLSVFVFRRAEALGTLLIGLAAMVHLWLLAAVALAVRFDVLVEMLGLHALTLGFAIGLLGSAIRFGWPARFARPRALCASFLAMLTTAGLLAYVHREWVLGEMSLAEVSAGGRVGRFLAGSPGGLLVWLAMVPGLVLVVWPQAPASVPALVRRGLRTLWRAGAGAVSIACPIDPAPDEGPQPWETAPSLPAEGDEEPQPVGSSTRADG